MRDAERRSAADLRRGNARARLRDPSQVGPPVESQLVNDFGERRRRRRPWRPAVYFGLRSAFGTRRSDAERMRAPASAVIIRLFATVR
jgi:hypothetical protein